MIENQEIKNFLNELKVNENPTKEEFYEAVNSAYMDRTIQIYFIWKKIKELYPEVDTNKIIREGSWDFGLYQGEKICKKYGSENIGPKEAIMGQTSRGGIMVFDQEILEFTDDKAVKMFNQCPHVKALTELGLSKEEIKMFCRDMLGHCDYAICEPFENVEIDFPTTVADGKGCGCAMTIRRKKN